MPDSMMYQEDAFVLLESDQPEQFLTQEELLEKLKQVLSTLETALPKELEKFSSLTEQAEYLKNNFCELDTGPGRYLQWYAVRLEK